MSGEIHAQELPHGSHGAARAARPTIFGTTVAALICVALAVFWTRGLPRSPSFGWDESMHAELPAVRIVCALGAGEIRAAFDALLSCAEYPFLFPSALAAVQAVFGIGEATTRAAVTVIWCAAIFGIYLLARSVASDRRELALSPWIAMALAALSPLSLAYAGTLFLEVPFACASVFALRAWVQRAARPSPCRDLASGAWIAVCCFTKFNYGALLAAGLGLDLVCQAVAAVRLGEAASFAKSALRIAAIPALVALWWFVLPLPGGADVAHEHRHALAAYLGGNLDLGATPYSLRLLHASTWLALTPRVLAIALAASLATLPLLSRPGVRALWCTLAALAVPTLAHPYHLDRFLIPISVPLWVLAGIGTSQLLPRRPALRAAALAALAVLALAFPGRSRLGMADRLGYLSADPATRSYQVAIYGGWSDLTGARPLPTAGLEQPAASELLDLVAADAGPSARIGWIGMSSEMSPGALHVGLLARGGERERVLRDAAQPMDVAYFGVDPQWSDGELARFAAGFDVVYATDPPDFKARSSRAWTARYRDRLLGLGWESREIGRIEVARPLGAPREVILFACRKKA